MKEKFIEFVKENPKLINYIKIKKGTWQELYEVYALYREDEKIWNKYILEEENNGVNDLIRLVRNLNLDGIKTTVEGLQKVISILQNISEKKDDNEPYEKTRKYEELDD